MSEELLSHVQNLSLYSSTPPITRSGFSFQNDLFWVEGDSHKHPRMDAIELYRLLTFVPPIPASSVDPNPKPSSSHKDPPAHFYSAQLAHYGLKVLKTKEPAKKKLLALFRSGGAESKVLDVPQSILELESKLKQEWDAAEALRKSKVTSTRADTATATFGEPALDPSLGALTKQHAVKTGGHLYDDSRKRSEGFLHKHFGESESRKMSNAFEANHFDTVTGQEQPRYRAKQTARKSAEAAYHRSRDQTRLKFDDDSEDSQSSIMGAKPKLTKEQMRRKISALSLESAQDLSRKVLEGSPQAESIMEPVLAAFQTGIESFGSQGNKTQIRHDEWAGLYNVHCRQITNESSQYTDSDFRLEMYPSSTSSHFWASFDFGILSGVMRSIGRLPTEPGEKVFIEWRGYDGNETQRTMTYSSNNRGVLWFFGEGDVQGNLHGDFCGGKLFFTATFKRTIPAKDETQQRKAVESWKGQFRRYNIHNYEVENMARWGKWGGEKKNDSPYESDTSDGHTSRQVDLNFDSFSSDPDVETSEEEEEEDELFWDV